MTAQYALMGRPPLNLTRLHLYLAPEDLGRIDDVVGTYGRSKFIRDAIRLQLDQVASGSEKAGPPYFESDGHHEPRLSSSGRATVFKILRKGSRSLDEMQKAFGFDDPIEFLHALLGHRPLPNQAASVVISELLDKLYEGE
jgi:hypothetical protein